MYPAAFDYVAPSSVDEAIKELGGGDAKILAGGHSLLPLMKLRLASPGKLVDLGKIQGLNYINQQGGGAAIGAMTTHAQVAASGLPLLSETAAHVGDIQVRNRGTLGGSLAHNDPTGDLPAAVLALDAEIVAKRPGGERTIKASEFFTGLLETALGEDEILTEVRVGGLPANTGVGEQAYRASGVENALKGQSASAESIKAAADHAVDGVDNVNGDIHASADYRRHLAKVYARRAIEEAVSRARGG